MLTGLLGACLLTLSGCFPEKHSEAYLYPQSTWQAVRAGSSKRIIGPDISIYISVSNIRWWTGGTPGERDFRITLWFAPERPNFAFDPRDSILVLDSTKKMSPSRVESKWTGNNNSSGWYGCNRYPVLDREPKYVLRRGSCFELYFDIEPPKPEKEFILRISGLSIDGKHLEVPDIYFQEARTWVLPISR